MNALTGLGRYLYAIPFLIFGAFHFMNTAAMAGMVPIAGGKIWIIITGLGHLGAAVSILIGKWDRLATLLLGIMLLIFALSIHLPTVIESSGENSGAMTNLLKDVALAGAAWMYSHGLARDRGATA